MIIGRTMHRTSGYVQAAVMQGATRFCSWRIGCDSYCPPDVSEDCVGAASDSAIVAQFVPAAEIH
jgi:hypothetical protein